MDPYTFIKNILFMDIETVTVVPEFDSLDERLKPLWIKKAGFLRNEEGQTPEELFFNRAGIYAEFGKIITISVGYFILVEGGRFGFRVKSIASDDEKDILLDFSQILDTKFDQQLRLCAHNGKEFDFPFICRRMLLNGIDLPEILDISEKKPWDIMHLDTMDMWKFGDRKNYTSLDLLAALFDVRSSKKEMDGSMVNQVYHVENDLDKISNYCRDDVVVLAQLFLKLKNLPKLDPENITVV